MRSAFAACALGGAAFVFAAFAFAQDRDGGGGIRPVPDRGLAVAVDTDRGTGAAYAVGDRISLRVRASEDCFLTVYDLTPGGRVQLIFPHAYDGDNRLRGGDWVSVPGPEDRWHYEIGNGPPGIEYVVAIATRDSHRPPPWLPGCRVEAPAAGASEAEALGHWRKAAADLNAKIAPVPDGCPGPGCGCGPHPEIATATTWLVVRAQRPRW